MTARFDLHVHTEASPCSQATPSDIVDAARGADLDGVAITDHDTMVGVARVREAAPSSITVVRGVETTTAQGHLLAYGIEDPPEPGSEPLAAIRHVHDRGGVAVLAHPFDWLREHYTDRLDTIADHVDGVETKNSRCLFSRFNDRAAEYAASHELPATGGSDAHFPHEVGRAVTIVREPVPSAIRAGETTSAGDDRFVSGHVLTKYNDFLKLIR